VPTDHHAATVATAVVGHRATPRSLAPYPLWLQRGGQLSLALLLLSITSLHATRSPLPLLCASVITVPRHHCCRQVCHPPTSYRYLLRIIRAAAVSVVHLHADDPLRPPFGPVVAAKTFATVPRCFPTLEMTAATPCSWPRHPLLQAIAKGTTLWTARLRSGPLPISPPRAPPSAPHTSMTTPVAPPTLCLAYHRQSPPRRVAPPWRVISMSYCHPQPSKSRPRLAVVLLAAFPTDLTADKPELVRSPPPATLWALPCFWCWASKPGLASPVGWAWLGAVPSAQCHIVFSFEFN
jgi:hypothetical protein